MRVLKWIRVVFVALVAVFVLGGLMLPHDLTVSRSIDIEDPVEAIFLRRNSVKATQALSAWLARDLHVQFTFAGPDAGIGAKMAWTSDDQQVGGDYRTGLTALEALVEV